MIALLEQRLQYTAEDFYCKGVPLKNHGAVKVWRFDVFCQDLLPLRRRRWDTDVRENDDVVDGHGVEVKESALKKGQSVGKKDL